MNAPQNQRFLFLDGLRGVAAFAVLLFHVATSEFFREAPGYVLPINSLCKQYGFLGVEIFFVISGFVIAYSLRNAVIDRRFTGRFIVRRSLRLDPPYWAAILCALAVSVVMTKVLHATTFAIPPVKNIVAHLFYVQGIAGQPQILIVFWTLCFEIQFYLLYMVLQFLTQRLTPRGYNASVLMQVILLVTGAASFAAFLVNNSVGGWAYNWWYLFALGALVCQQMVSRRLGVVYLAAGIVLMVGLATHHSESAAGALTALSLCLACKFNGLCTWLSSGPIQYMGRISYSLYLTHTLALQMLTSVLLRIHRAPVLGSVPAYFIMVGLPIGCAEIFYRLVEGPSHRWATNFGRRGRDAVVEPANRTQCVTVESPIHSPGL